MRLDKWITVESTRALPILIEWSIEELEPNVYRYIYRERENGENMRKLYPEERGGFMNRNPNADLECGFTGARPNLVPVHYDCRKCHEVIEKFLAISGPQIIKKKPEPQPRLPIMDEWRQGEK